MPSKSGANGITQHYQATLSFGIEVVYYLLIQHQQYVKYDFNF